MKNKSGLIHSFKVNLFELIQNKYLTVIGYYS